MAIGSTLSGRRRAGFQQPFDRPVVQFPDQQQPVLKPQPLTQPTVAGAQVQGIQPGQNDLRGTQITPLASPRLQETQGQTQTAQRGLVAFPGFTPYQRPADTTTGRAEAFTTEAAGLARTPYGAIQPGAGDQQQVRDLALRAAGQGLGVGGYSQASDVARARALALQNVEADTPSRLDLAQRAFNLFTGEQDEVRGQRVREAGQNAARFGRIGAGMTTSTLNDLESQFDLNRVREGERLALDASGQELQDRLNRAGAAQGLAGTFGGLDLNAAQLNATNALNAGRFGLDAASTVAGLDRGFRDEARGERGFQAGLDQSRAGFLAGLGDTTFGRGLAGRGEARTDQDLGFGREQADFGARRAILGDLGGRESQQFGQEAIERDELRGERGYQDELSREGIDRAIQQRLLEETLQDQEIGRNRGEQSDLYRLGYGPGDPTGALGQQAGALEQQADQSGQALGDALSAYGLNQGLSRIEPGPAGGVPRVGPRDLPVNLPPTPNFDLRPQVPSIRDYGIDVSRLTPEQRLRYGLPVGR